MPSRREFLQAGACALAGFSLEPAVTQAGQREHVLRAQVGAMQLADDGGPPLPVFTYNGRAPGPVLRFRVGEPVRIRLQNALDRPTTVHWHGLRVPNAMDGVPYLTQPPVAPGEEFVYAFVARNPGTYWYHPHFQSAEQLERGLAGAIVVEDGLGPDVDRDLVWVVDDWRLDNAGDLLEDFGNLHDASHAGRLGNVPSVNGRIPEPLRVRSGERLRLRIVNVANARIFALDFGGHRPTVIAYDGHAVVPHAPADGVVVVGPSMRTDLILDCTAAPGSRHAVRDRAYPRFAYDLLSLEYSADAPLRQTPLSPPDALAPPALPEPQLAAAKRHELHLTGGAMGGMRDALLDGERLGIRELARRGKVWALNGVVASGHTMAPMLELERGTSHVLAIHNETAFPHPMHLHGHPLKILSRNGQPPPHALWRDTVLVAPRERMEVAFVADNPGKWMIHCHIPEHLEAGLMGVVAVS